MKFFTGHPSRCNPQALARMQAEMDALAIWPTTDAQAAPDSSPQNTSQLARTNLSNRAGTWRT